MDARVFRDKKKKRNEKFFCSSIEPQTMKNPLKMMSCASTTSPLIHHCLLFNSSIENVCARMRLQNALFIRINIELNVYSASKYQQKHHRLNKHLSRSSKGSSYSYTTHSCCVSPSFSILFQFLQFASSASHHHQRRIRCKLFLLKCTQSVLSYAKQPTFCIRTYGKHRTMTQ